MSGTFRTYLGATTCAVVAAGCLLTAAGPAGADPGNRNGPSAGVVAPAPPLSLTDEPALGGEPTGPRRLGADGPTRENTGGSLGEATTGSDTESTTAAETPALTIDEARQRIEILEQQSAAAAERANAAREELAQARLRMEEQAGKVAAVRLELSQQQRTLEQLARQIYVNGGMSNAAVSFALDDPDEFLADLDRLISASDSQSAVLVRTRASAVELKEASEALESEHDVLVQATADLGQAEAEATSRLARSWQTLAELEEAERLRLAEEARIAEETSRLEAEMARQALAAQALAEQQSAEQQAAGGLAAGRTTSSPAVPGGAGQQVGSASVQRVIDFALSKVGGRYVWGASGPDAYDCSGLTQAAWAQAGLRLTHYSGTQYTETRPVALDSIQPGDLLYFYSIHQHVGMYVGNGKFVHAANPNDGIRLDSLTGYYVDNLVAASRPGA